MELATRSNATLQPYYPFKFNFEDRFDVEATIAWSERNYYRSLYIVAVYLASVFIGTAYMKNKPALNLKNSLIVWNILLAIFSTFGAMRAVAEHYNIMYYSGFKATYCVNCEKDSVAVCWTYLFCMSKVAELLDTAFVILRKQKLTVLHWFHHSTVLIWTWFLGRERVAMGRWFMSMNFTVHSFMYSYYALRALKIHIPRKIAMCITIAQVSQMLVGFYISICGFVAWFVGDKCDITGRIAVLSLTLYSFYFVLFVNFFLQTYLVPVFRKKRAKSNTD